VSIVHLLEEDLEVAVVRLLIESQTSNISQEGTELICDRSRDRGIEKQETEAGDRGKSE
jgi:hypothetical protein